MPSAGATASAHAQVPTGDAAMTPVLPSRPLSPAQLKAIAWLRARPGVLNLPCPMDRPDPAPAPAVKDAPAPAPAVAAAPVDDTPKLTLTGVLGSGSQSLATIDHRVYKVGAQVVPGWTLAQIDGRKRMVVLVHSDGRRLELTSAAVQP